MRPLPLKIHPHPDETTRSFLHRLETANALHPGQLRKTLRRARRPWIETLAAWTGDNPQVLSLAMPQLRQRNETAVPRSKLVGRPDRTILGTACRHCALARGAGRYVEIYTTHERVICPRHGLWIGDGIQGFTDQLPILACPDIIAAWHHHKNLITRHSRSRVRKAFHISSVINWRWYDQFHHFTHAIEIYDALAADQPRHSQSQAMVAASLYPSIVSLTATIASPFWARIAHSRHPNAFLDRISDEVTDGWQPRGAFDSLRHWMDTDWQPTFKGADIVGSPGSTRYGLRPRPLPQLTAERHMQQGLNCGKSH